MDQCEWLTSTDPERMLALVEAHNCPSHSGGTVGPKTSDRKLRLFACACAAIHGNLCVQERVILDAAYAVADGLEDRSCFDRLCTDHVRFGLFWCCHASAHEAARMWAQSNLERPAPRAALLRDVVGNPFRPAHFPTIRVRRPSTRRLPPLAHPMVPVAEEYDEIPVRPAWLTPAARSMTHAAYQERLPTGFLDDDRLAVLADALEEAGCRDDGLLQHLRGEEDYVFQKRCAGEVVGRGNKGLGYYEYWECLSCGNRCLIAPQTRDGRCHVITEVKMTHSLRGRHARGCWAVDAVLGKD